MNEAGREALVSAALRGVRQIKGQLSDDMGGRCAMGVLMDACGHDAQRFSNVTSLAQLPTDVWGAWWKALVATRRTFAITYAEVDDIVDRNNGTEAYAQSGPQDFLTIARKVGTEQRGLDQS